MMLSTLYAAVARRRREWYAARPEARRRLRRPVISIGNIAVGGRGKTPMAATVARQLLEMGERPAILSRGYAREDRPEGIVIVRDPDRIRADVSRSGDEPFMLARQLHGVSVLVSADRYAAGRLAELHLGATVHVLDDGFQHLQLDRDIDLVLVSPDDVSNPATLPAGRLREPLDTLIAADAVVTLEEGLTSDLVAPDVPVFGASRRIGPVPSDVPRPVLAVAGIASPARFFDDLRREGVELATTISFADHHAYSPGDVERIYSLARSAGARGVLTTEKDFVRLLRFRPFPVPTGWVPLTIEPEPLGEFRNWLAEHLAAARDVIA